MVKGILFTDVTLLEISITIMETPYPLSNDASTTHDDAFTDNMNILNGYVYYKLNHII